MFTDGPATPVRLEVLLDVLGQYSSGLKREVIYELLQPVPLSGGGQGTAKDTLGAALQLDLAKEKQGVILSPAGFKSESRSAMIITWMKNRISVNIFSTIRCDNKNKIKKKSYFHVKHEANI